MGLKDVLTLMEKTDQAGADLRSLTEVIDTTSPGGRMMVQIVGTFAEFEGAMLRERTQRGLDAVRKQARGWSSTETHGPPGEGNRALG